MDTKKKDSLSFAVLLRGEDYLSEGFFEIKKAECSNKNFSKLMKSTRGRVFFCDKNKRNIANGKK